MILSDGDSTKALADGRIAIEPLDDPDMQIQPASVELRMGTRFIVFRHAMTPFIDPLAQDATDYTQVLDIAEDERFILHPGEFVLGSTKERVRLADDLVGRVDGRSSIGRLGIQMHAPAGFIDPSFEGNITLELSNVRRMPVALHPNLRVCEILLE